MKDKIVVLCFLCVFVMGLFFWANHSFATVKYTVKTGDTMWKISKEQQVDFSTLLKLNQQISPPELIFPGQTIYLPEKLRLKNQPEEEYQQRMLTMINNVRQQHHLRPLSIHYELNRYAVKKAQDMLIHKKIAHKSPTYGNPTDMLEAFHFPYKRVYENIGAGSKTAEDMFETWMNTQVNRHNILSEKATYIGIGCAKGGLHGNYWTLLIVDN